MVVYEVLLHGRGLKLVDQSGTMREGGVYAWRVVIAESEATAVVRARECLLEDPLFTGELWNQSPEDLVFEVEEIRQKPLEQESSQPGPVFYIEEDESAQ